MAAHSASRAHEAGLAPRVITPCRRVAGGEAEGGGGEAEGAKGW